MRVRPPRRILFDGTFFKSQSAPAGLVFNDAGCLRFICGHVQIYCAGGLIHAVTAARQEQPKALMNTRIDEPFDNSKVGKFFDPQLLQSGGYLGKFRGKSNL